MERWLEKAAIVTGASSGIGYAITELLVDAGVTVIGVARGQTKLDTLKEALQGRKGIIHIFKADISKESDVLSLFKYVKENIGPVHILVNNAGAYADTNLTEGKTELWREVLDTNILGLCITTREAVQNMRKNNTLGHIIHIGSIQYYHVASVPDISVYTASKRAVVALAETLRNEFHAVGDKIKISTINPGYVKTQELDDSTVSGKYFNALPSLKPEDVANAVVYILATPLHVQVQELIIKPLGEPF